MKRNRMKERSQGALRAHAMWSHQAHGVGVLRSLAEPPCLALGGLPATGATTHAKAAPQGSAE
jgi:hypothetical protein